VNSSTSFLYSAVEEKCTVFRCGVAALTLYNMHWSSRYHIQSTET